MKNTIFTIAMLAILGVGNVARGQNFVWAKQMGGTVSDYANSIGIDAFGCVYTTGTFQGTADFDPSPLIFNLTSSGHSDIFVSKLDASGNFIWAKQMGGTNMDFAVSIAIDAFGFVYTTGTFQGTADFDPGIDTYNLTSSSLNNIFISKLDASGNFVWAKQVRGDGSYCSAIAIDGFGNVCTSGYFFGKADFNPGLDTFNITSMGSNDIFMFKLDNAGNFKWAKNIGGTGDDRALSLGLDPFGNIYTTGVFQETTDFDPGVDLHNLNSAGGQDIFFLKTDSSGNFITAKKWGGIGNEGVNSITVDTSGNVYTLGNFNGTLDCDPDSTTFNITSAGNRDIFISKLDHTGNFIWAKRIGGTGYDIGHSILIDGSENIYTTGSFSGTADFDPGPDTFNLTSAGRGDIFISKIDAGGNFVWANRMGGVNSDGPSSFSLDPSGYLYITGPFRETADFDPSGGVFNLTVFGNQQDHDIFITKLDNINTTLSEPLQTVNLRVFPNPTEIDIILDLSNYTNAIAEIYNIEGHLMHHVPIQFNRTAVPVSHLPNGIYFVKVSTSEGTVTKKFVKN